MNQQITQKQMDDFINKVTISQEQHMNDLKNLSINESSILSSSIKYEYETEMENVKISIKLFSFLRRSLSKIFMNLNIINIVIRIFITLLLYF
jgi:hypothetical protein